MTWRQNQEGDTIFIDKIIIYFKYFIKILKPCFAFLFVTGGRKQVAWGYVLKETCNK